MESKPEQHSVIFESTPVTTGIRRLKARWSVELEQDMISNHGFKPKQYYSPEFKKNKRKYKTKIAKTIEDL